MAHEIQVNTDILVHGSRQVAYCADLTELAFVLYLLSQNDLETDIQRILTKKHLHDSDSHQTHTCKHQAERPLVSNVTRQPKTATVLVNFPVSVSLGFDCGSCSRKEAYLCLLLGVLGMFHFSQIGCTVSVTTPMEIVCISPSASFADLLCRTAVIQFASETDLCSVQPIFPNILHALPSKCSLNNGTWL